ncbi:MAG: hypothetical protein V2A73_14225 [Pseudomonadota bacterium]
MAIQVQSSCGQSFSLKDELAGKLVQCPACGENLRVPMVAVGSSLPARLAQRVDLDQAFQHQKFLLRQKHFAISDKYSVGDEQGTPILFVHRPAHLLRNIGALFAGLAAGVLCIAFFASVAAAFDGTVGTIIWLVAIPATLAVVLVFGVGLSAKRHVTFYSDETKTKRLLCVEQDRKWMPIVATFTVRDPAGQVLGRLSKNYLYNFIRKRWYCHGADGVLLATIKEDSIILSLMRRFLGPLFGLLRTNFVFLRGDSEHVIGEFNRKLTLLDRYVLDMSADESGHLDPRLAIATGVMLDTGERR